MTATGSGTSLTATGATTIDAAGLHASGGATLSLPNATTFSAPNGNGDWHWDATGANSVLSLPNLTTIGTLANNWMLISATQGGEIDLSSLNSVSSSRPVQITADGSASTIDLSSLATLKGLPGYGLITVTNGATLADANLTSLDGVNVTVDNCSTWDYSQISSYTNGTMSISCGTYNWGSGTSGYINLSTGLNGVGNLITEGGQPDANWSVSAANFTGSTTSGSTLVTNVSSFAGLEIGQTVTGNGIPAGTSITAINTSNNTLTLSQNATATASGVALSVAAAPAQTVFPGSADWYGNWPANTNSDWIAVNASQPTQPNTPYTFTRTFDLTGFDLSTVHLSGNWNIDDVGTRSLNGNVIDTQNNPWGGSFFPTFSVSGANMFNQGSNMLTITINSATPPFEAVRLDGAITGEFSGSTGLVDADGATFNVSNAASVTLPVLRIAHSTSFVISSGATLIAPALTNSSYLGNSPITLEATGAGSQLSLANLTSLTASPYYNAAVTVQALAGGSVNLSSLPQLSSGPVTLESDGTGSTLDVSALTSFSVVSGSWKNGLLQATNHGTLIDPNLHFLQNVDLTLDGTGTASIAQISAFTGGTLTMTGGTLTWGSGTSGLINLSTGLNGAGNVIGLGDQPDANWTVSGPSVPPAPPQTVFPGFNFTGNVTSGSATITNVSSTAGLTPGQIIRGSGIPNVFFNGDTTTGSTTIANVTGGAALLVGDTISGPGIVAGTTITNINGSTITISTVATASASSVGLTQETTILAVGPGSVTLSRPATSTSVAGFFNIASDWYDNGWVANDATSDWLAVSGVGPNQPLAPFTFSRTFDLTGYNLATVYLSGGWDGDDAATLALNGHAIATSYHYPLGNGHGQLALCRRRQQATGSFPA